MKLGIDFDNTIANYDHSFEEYARTNSIILHGNETPKISVRKALGKKTGGNLDWTRLQGDVYGSKMSDAQPNEGFVAFLEECLSRAWQVVIISHRTIYPAIGKPTNLHSVAFEWLKDHRIVSEDTLAHSQCFYETTLNSKIFRISQENCDAFIDDLPSVLQHQSFPSSTSPLLFGSEHNSLPYALDWPQVLIQVESIKGTNCQARKLVKKQSGETLPTNEHAGAFGELLGDVHNVRDYSLMPLGGGPNNRTYEISLQDKTRSLGKVYYRDEKDSRDRLKNETIFLKALNAIRIPNVPLLKEKDEGRGIAVHSWIDGRNADEMEFVPNKVWGDCIDFIKKIQEIKKQDTILPPASESAFSFREHMELLQRRRDNWRSFALRSPKDLSPALYHLVTTTLEEKYQSLAEQIVSHPKFKTSINKDERILSPSDFGLHNILIDEKGKCHFIDFEYAGWDDPAKTLADFFAQPRRPAPIEFYPKMRDTLADLVPSEYRDSFYERVPLVDQIIRLKWCYIILNQIHPEEKKRREFAGVHHVSEKSIFDRILFLDKQFGTPVQEEALLDSHLLRGNQISWKTS
jgi:thiamine kinase-like enzyme